MVIDTEDLYTIAYQNILTPYNKEYTYDLKVKLMGMQDKEAAKLLLSTLDIPMSIEEWVSAVKDQYKKLFPDSELKPGMQ